MQVCDECDTYYDDQEYEYCPDCNFDDEDVDDMMDGDHESALVSAFGPDEDF